MGKTNQISILIAGLGSIGQRHLRNLVTLGVDEISLLRSGRGKLINRDLDAYPTYTDPESALNTCPTAVIVSNPTSMHLDTALAAAETGCHLLIEKPVSHTLDRTDQLSRLVEEKHLVVLTGFQFRFHPAFVRIREWLDRDLIGEIVSVHAHWGEYLPGWHPWEDYRTAYSARKDMGGGVTLTLCHPFDYLRYFLGEVVSVSAMLEQRSGFNLDVEDTAQVMLRFKNGSVGTVYLDYIEKPPRHELIIVGQSGSIVWNQQKEEAVLHAAGRHMSITFSPNKHFERNTMFLDEMKHFLACIQGKQDSLCTLDDGIQALKIVEAVKESSNKKQEVELASV